MKHVILESSTNLNQWLLPLLQYGPFESLVFFRALSPYLNDNVHGLIESKYIGFNADGIERPDRVQLLLEKRDNLFNYLLLESFRNILVAITLMKPELQNLSAGIRSIQRLVDMEYSSCPFPYAFLVSSKVCDKD